MRCDFGSVVADGGLDISPLGVRTLQLNITRLCNQACSHCHVDASPARDESMPDDVLAACVAAVAGAPSIAVVDITGGAPELHPRFEELVAELRALGRDVIVRHNLTVTLEPHPLSGRSLAHLPRFFAEQGVRLVCSLPCWLSENTDRQRGAGVHAKSVESLRRLNAEGYGVEGSGLRLDLAHNPGGLGLPGRQDVLEAGYRRELGARHGIVFDRLLVMNNMPINRFADTLRSSGEDVTYLRMLSDACDPSLLAGVMCRSLVSVAPDGTLHDCDFNQALGLPLASPAPGHVGAFDADALARREIVFGEHCLGCLAGAGSGCEGALVNA